MMTLMRKRSLVAGLAAAGLAFGAGPALAYIGPGAGLSLLGALWGVIAAVAAAMLFLLLWPLRRMMRRKRAAAPRTAAQQRRQTSSEAPGASRGR
jgi:type VI protein secretion system component VasK